MNKILKRGLALLLCLIMIFNYSFSVLADENVESSEPETTYTETVETTESTENAESIETTESIEESESEENEFEEEIEEPEEADISSPSEITDEENEEIDDVLEEPEEEPEEDLPEEVEEPAHLDTIASSSDTEEVEKENEEEIETEEEIDEASPSEIEELPMLTMTPPLFGASGPASTWDELKNAIDTSSTGDVITLSANVTVTDTYAIENGKDVTIDLNGHTIDGNGNRIFILEGKLKIQDSGTGGTITRGDAGTGNGGAVAIKGTGELTLESGTFTENSAKNGGAISIDEDGGKFIMNGGKISGNTSSSNGAGIYTNVASTTIKMNGGEISGNIATNGGGGVYLNNAEMQLNGGKIINNTAGAGAGICVSSNLNTKLYLGGNSVVKDNAKSSGDIDNIYLVSLGVSTLYISTTTPLTSGAELYVTVRINAAGDWGPGKDVGQYFNSTMTDSNYQYFYFTNCGDIEKNTVYSVKKSGGNYVTAAPPECKIGSTKYSTLEEAIAVANNQTITMLKDITLSESRPISFTTGKTMTVDFNGYKVKNEYSSNVSSPLFSIGNSNVTIKNLKYYTDYGNNHENVLFKITSQGSLTLENMESLSGDNIKDTIIYNDGGKVTVLGGNIITTFVTDNPNGMFINTAGGEFTIKNSGSYTVNSVIDIPLISSGISYDGIDENVGNIIIDNGTFTGPKGISAFGKGNITINDANFITNIVFGIQESGIKTIITINNITANCNEGFLVEKASLQNKVDFQNGSVIYKPDWFSVIYIGGISPIPTPTQDVLIKKGKFGPTTGFDEYTEIEISNLIASGSIIEPFSSGTVYKYEVKAVPAVCKIGTTEYATLQEALTAVTSGQTITMLQDVSYSDGTDFVINGKTVTIDFDGHKITVSIAGMTTINKLFTVTNSGNLTVDSGEIVLSGMYNTVAPFTVTGVGSKLTLIDMTQASNLDRLLTLDGGTATINGGTFGTNNTATKINLTNNATLKLINNPIFNCQGNVINISATSNTDADTLMGNVIVDSGDFNSSNTAGIIAFYGKANVTINGGTFTSSSAQSAPIFIGNAGYKSSLTINNLTSDSPYVFSSNNNPNVESFTATINNGHFKYTKGKFAIDSSNSKKPNIRLKGGFYGPDVPDTDAFNELNDLCISGSTVQTLSSSDPEYANGYRYKIYNNTPSPTPTPPSGGGGSSGGGGGGGAGLPKYDSLGNIISPTGIQGYDGTNPPNLTGNITISQWNYNTKKSQIADIHYVQNMDSFVRGNNNPVITEWVGISTNTNSKVLWYRTNANGKIYRNVFLNINNYIYYFDNNGIMVTGQHTINGKVYNFETAVGATEGRFLY